MFNATMILSALFAGDVDLARVELAAQDAAFIAGEADMIKGWADRLDRTSIVPVRNQIVQIVKMDLEQEDGVMDLFDIVTSPLHAREIEDRVIRFRMYADKNMASPIAKMYFFHYVKGIVGWLSHAQTPNGFGQMLDRERQDAHALSNHHQHAQDVAITCAVHYLKRVEAA